MAKSKGKDLQTNAYTVRYPDDESGLIEAAAKAKSLKPATWIRMVSVEAARREARDRAGAKD